LIAEPAINTVMNEERSTADPELLDQNLHQQCHVQVGGQLEFIWRIFLLFPGTIQPRVVDKFGGYRYRAINRVSPLLQVR
jgi:hypothetical protein